MTWTLFAADGTSLHLRGLLARLRRALQRAEAGQHDSALCTNDARRPDAAGALQHEPVLAAVHRARRRALRRVGQLQPHRRAARRGRRRGRRRRRAPAPRRRASTTAARCCSPSRPTAATPSRRRSRSPTTTTCPTARPTRARTPASRLRAREGRDGQLDLPRHQLPVGRGQPARPEARSTSRSAPTSTATPTSAATPCVPQGYNPDTFQPLYTASRRRARATTTS